MTNLLDRPDIERMAIKYAYLETKKSKEIMDLIQYCYRLEKVFLGDSNAHKEGKDA